MIRFFLTLSLFSTVVTELQVQTVRRGDNVTIKCGENKAENVLLIWYKQSLGKLPQSVVRILEDDKHCGSPRVSKDRYRWNPAFQNRRFSLTTENFDLNITGFNEEDLGIYFCGKGRTTAIEFTSGTLLLFADEKTDHHPLTETSIKNKESVKLHCSVQTLILSCSGEHIVYWFRDDSGGSHPGIIYTHRASSDQCEKSSETGSPTQNCVYKLPKRNLNLSDAGTHYCAVATCDKEPKTTEREKNHWTVIALTTSNILFVIVIMVLAGLLYKRQHQGSISADPGDTKNETEDTDDLKYATVSFAKKPPPRTPKDRKSQDIYSEVRVR